MDVVLFGKKNLKNKTACVIFWNHKKYDKLAENAIESFKFFHNNVDLFAVNNNNVKQYKCSSLECAPGIMKMLISYEIFKNYEKVIILGADTITCSRLDEFMDNNDDILASLDYPYYIVDGAKILCPTHELHLNADVVCFNSKQALKDVISCSLKHKTYFEQGGLNEVCWSNNFDYTFKVVDSPYVSTKVLYNVRSKGNIVAKQGEKPWKQYTDKFYVDDNKLFNGDSKQIKVWHYCEGFGTRTQTEVEKMIKSWSTDFFNQQTKEFFVSIGCKNYF